MDSKSGKPCREIYRPPSLRKGVGVTDEHKSTDEPGRRTQTQRESLLKFNIHAKEFQLPASEGNPNQNSVPQAKQPVGILTKTFLQQQQQHEDDKCQVQTPQTTHESNSTTNLRRSKSLHAAPSIEIGIDCQGQVTDASDRSVIETIRLLFEGIFKEHGRHTLCDGDLVENTAQFLMQMMVSPSSQLTASESVLNLLAEQLALQKVHNQNWVALIELCSQLYSKVKSKLIQVHQRPSLSFQSVQVHVQALESTNRKLLELLSLSLLGVVRALLSGCAVDQIVPILFVAVTTHGVEIQRSYPQLMKELMEGLRDLLLVGDQDHCLRLGEYKQLMQLVELQAAGWTLSASALRYYYQ